jgi:transcriptional regulator with XRE-family HTH domain
MRVKRAIASGLISQHQFANMAGMGQATVSRIMRGEGNPSYTSLQKMEKAIDSWEKATPKRRAAIRKSGGRG